MMELMPYGSFDYLKGPCPKCGIQFKDLHDKALFSVDHVPAYEPWLLFLSDREPEHLRMRCRHCNAVILVDIGQTGAIK